MPKLFKLDLSPPARAAMMACELFNVTVEMVDVNLGKREQNLPEFLKKNPVHTIPVYEDGDLILHDSHVILTYLADTYGKDDSWYPKDTKKRSQVNQKLFFDATILFPRLRAVTYPILREGSKSMSEKQINDIKDAYGFMNEFLSRTKYFAADHMTIADISAFSTVSSLVYLVNIDEKYPKLQGWFNEMEKLPIAKNKNAPGATQLGDIIKKALN